MERSDWQVAATVAIGAPVECVLHGAETSEFLCALASGARPTTTGEPMTFQTPVTVQDILSGIHEKQYLLPAIQREFVWDQNQIRRLVDSLMRGYPIGSFLLWGVNAETAGRYVFYDFLT